jgi:hypothetical protein
MPEPIPLITLLTDFGLQDHYVGVMKGVIYRINPQARIVDICHNVRPQDILQAAFLLRVSYAYFPKRTLHVVVVDPEVGTSRRPILVSTESYYFIAPDNGVLSYIYQIEPIGEVREITASHYFLNPVSQTFHGRDVFAPIAAWLSRGVAPNSLGDLITDYKKFTVPVPTLVKEDILLGRILYIDRFGNLVSNITRKDFTEHLEKSSGKRFVIRIGDRNLTKICNSYTEGSEGELIAIFGSSDFLEFSINKGNAAKTLGLQIGAEVLCKVA